MERKIKLLAVGDHIAKTGFSRVLEGILTNLPAEDYDISVLGVNYFGDPHKLPYRVYPAMTPQYPDQLGMQRLPLIIAKEHPDIIFMLSDVWVLNDYLKVLKQTFANGRPKVVIYFPVDARDHNPDWYRNFDFVDQAVVYTEFGKAVASKAAPNVDFKIMPHGFNPKDFFQIPLPKQELKKALFNDPFFYDNSFVVLNANRNQPRKKLWITMEAFKLFSEGKPENVRLYMHCGIRDSDIDVGELATRLGIDNRLHISTSTAGPQQVKENRLNLIYNACDVGVNTSAGEGWGLVGFEHGVTGAPQVLPDHSANHELYADCGLLVPPVMDEIFGEGIMTRGALVRPEDVAERLEWLYTDKGLYNSLSAKILNKFNNEQYHWSNISKLWDSTFKEVITRN